MESRMAPNLLKSVTDEFRGDTLNQLASAIGEPPSKTQTALNGIVPTLLSSLGSKIASPGGAEEALDAIWSHRLATAQYTGDTGALAAPGGLSRVTGLGESLVRPLLGARADGITEAIASYAGINRASAGSLLSLALPIVLSVIGRRAGTVGGGVNGLRHIFRGQNFLSDLPAGLSSILSLGGATATARQGLTEVEEQSAAPPPSATRKSSEWLWVLLLLATVAGLIWLLISLFRSEPSKVSVNVPSVSIQTDARWPDVQAIGA